jgi:predicted PhzF superfamily epimerase YddE/YHI9
VSLKIYIANAFADNRFGGNPAAVVPLTDWLPDELMQKIAAQNNLAETAFIVPQGEDFHIRWFTPTVEVALCGHATLASAHIFFNHLHYQQRQISFHSKSGLLKVSKAGDEKITLDFPADQPVPLLQTGSEEQGAGMESLVPSDPATEREFANADALTQSESVQIIGLMEKALKRKLLGVYKSAFDFIAVLKDQEEVENLAPDLVLVARLPGRGLIVTAKGKNADFVSRCFFPQSGIDEDPVTGSAHTVLVPYWANILGKTKLSAIQLSERRGYLDCELIKDRVLISGKSFTYLTGEINI